MSGASRQLPPALDRPALADQNNLPAWADLERALSGIFERRYYANNGPLVQELDAALAAHCGASSAVCVANEGVAFALLAAALESPGEVLVPAVSSGRMRQALRWGGLQPVKAEGASDPFDFETDAFVGRQTSRISAICGVHAWGRVCAVAELERFAERGGLPLIFDGTGAFGCARKGKGIGAFGLATVFSLHGSTVLNGGDAAFIATSDEALAKKLRTMRNFHPGETFATVPLRINGKVSEAQAALALLSLEQFPVNVACNQARSDAYRIGLADLPGVSLLPFDPNDRPNYAEVVVRIRNGDPGPTAGAIARLLARENIFCSGAFDGPEEFLAAEGLSEISTGDPKSSCGDALLRGVLRLPNAQWLTVQNIRTICTTFARALAECDRGLDRSPE